MRSSSRWCGFALAAARILLAPEPVAAQGVARALDVPYIAQAEALCGGAASAMVLRYWGARGVRAEEFVSLLNPRGDGIEAQVLVDALVERGWRAFPFTGTTSSVTRHLSLQRPIIALIASGPARFHYVVLVQISDSLVVYHDPAGRPFQTMSIADFERAWSVSSRWSLLLLPGESIARNDTPIEPAPAVPAACRPELLKAATAAAQRQFDHAEQLIDAARTACPTAAAPLRELAGLRLLQSRTADAVLLARAAVAQDSSDRHAWRILGTAEFLLRNQAAALSAWNNAGEPLTDLVQVEGLVRTRHRVVTDRMGLAHGRLLTSSDLERARRRLSELPAVGPSRVEVAPVGGGLVEVKTAVLERPVLPTSRLALGALGVRAAVNREATWRVASLTGGGERLDISARWWEGRRAAGVALSVPVQTRFIAGVVSVAGSVAQESFQSASPAGTPLVEDRRSVSVGISDWATANLRWQLSARADRWVGRPAALGIGGALEHRVGETLAFRAQSEVWPASGFGVASVGARWRWLGDGVDRLTASVTATVAGRDAPRALWSGAGTGHARPLLLRAHPLLDDGVIVGDAFGRRLLHGTAEWRQRLASIGPLTLQLAAFTDAATSTRGDGPPFAHLDTGVGLRVRVPGEGTLRVDYACGLDDGRQAMSVGWELPWPAWP